MLSYILYHNHKLFFVFIVKLLYLLPVSVARIKICYSDVVSWYFFHNEIVVLHVFHIGEETLECPLPMTDVPENKKL